VTERHWNIPGLLDSIFPREVNNGGPSTAVKREEEDRISEVTTKDGFISF